MTEPHAGSNLQLFFTHSLCYQPKFLLVCRLACIFKQTNASRLVPKRLGGIPTKITTYLPKYLLIVQNYLTPGSSGWLTTANYFPPDFLPNNQIDDLTVHNQIPDALPTNQPTDLLLIHWISTNVPTTILTSSLLPYPFTYWQTQKLKTNQIQ